ncbi:MAG: cation:proton antiporter [Nitrososphaerota archaeon]|jgi:cell volume regulation protein A|nr:cation:proton antiporter [Nitrososphaerota archaeon]
MDNKKIRSGSNLHKLTRRGIVLSFVSMVFAILLISSVVFTSAEDDAVVTKNYSLNDLTHQNSITAFNKAAISLDTAVHVNNEATLKAVINDSTEPIVIALTTDISLTESTLNIPISKNITLVSDKEEGFWRLIGTNGHSTITVRGTLTLAGIVVTHNEGKGSGVIINPGGTLTMVDGEISGNSADNGGGVYNGGTFYMLDKAVISDNTATKNGGGVYNVNGCTFTISESKISGNKANQGDDVFNEGSSASGGSTNAMAIFGVVAGIIVVGFAGEFLIKKVGIPIFIFLILAGIVLGPGLNIFPRESLLSMLALFATLTLLMVLFHAGLGLKTRSVLAIGSRVFVQTIIYTLVGTALLGLLGHFVLKWDVLQAFIFAAIIGGEITAAVIVPLSSSMKLKEKTVAFLTMEAAISSVFSVVMFTTLINIYLTGESSIVNALTGISMQFSVGVIAGLLLSILWVLMLHRFQKHKFTHVLTMGFILATYSITSYLGGNGTLAVLVFGIIFGNYHLINRILKTKINIDKLHNQIAVFYEEIAFLLETLFFVSLGLIFVIEPSLLLAGIMFTVVLLLTRFGAVKISTVKSDLAKDQKIITFMCALGLTPATLAILTISYGLPLANNIVNVVTYVIIFTNIITAVWSTYYLRKKKQTKKESMEQKEEIRENKE